MKKFWEQSDEYIQNFEEDRTVTPWVMSAKLGNDKVEDIIRGQQVPGVNANGEFLLYFCAERGMFLADTYF